MVKFIRQTVKNADPDKPWLTGHMSLSVLDDRLQATPFYWCVRIFKLCLTLIRKIRRPVDIFSRTTTLEASQYRLFMRVGLACVYDAPMDVLRLVRAQVSRAVAHD